MALEMMSLRELSATHCAFERLFASMQSHVHYQIVFATERFRTAFTVEGFLAAMNP